MKLIVECDGGSRGNPGIAGYGAIVFGADNAEVHAKLAAPIGHNTNNVAEYQGLLAALEVIRDHAPNSQVLVRMDSKLVVEQMSGRWKAKNPAMRELLMQCQAVSAQLRASGGNVQYQWIPRNENSRADALANDGMDGVTVEYLNFPEAQHQDELDIAQPQAEKILNTQDSAGNYVGAGGVRRLLVVRHAVTEFTVTHRLDGRGGANPPLNELGHEQAQRVAFGVAGRLAEYYPDGFTDQVSLLTSSLTRAKQTGAAIGKKIGKKPTVDARWDEQSFGQWDGLSIGEIYREHPEEVMRLRNDDSFAAPEGETRSELLARVQSGLKSATSLSETVVVVTHRMPILLLIAQSLGLSTLDAWRVNADPASVTGIEFYQDDHCALTFVNDTVDRRMPQKGQ